MKIVRIIARLNVGGPARHVTLLNAGLQARGHHTLLVHGSLDEGEASLEAPAIASGIPIVRTGHLGRRVSATSDVRAFAAVLRAIFREQPDVIHTHTAKAGALGRVAALVYNATRPRARRALVLHTFHGHVLEGYFSPAVSRLVRTTERWLARACDRIVTISPKQRLDIVERFAIARTERTIVVPLGLVLDPFLALPPGAADMRPEVGATPADVIVGYAGRMVPVKDLQTLLRAFALAFREVPSLRLLLAGDGPDRAALVRLAGELGITERVQFIGWVEDLPRFYATVDLFALSSLNEGTPVAAIEAMAAARPVVSTDVGGVADVVEAGVSGLLVRARDPEAFAGALVQLARDPARRQRMGAAARAHAATRYSHVRLVDELERVYVEALSAKRGAVAGAATERAPGGAPRP